MAKPVGTKDIEDVVSSVRRLVAPEASPRPMSRDLGAERLLLTPALQVVTDHEAVNAQPVIPVQTDVSFDPVPLAETTGALPLGPFANVVSEVQPSSDAHLQVVDGEWDDVFWSEAGEPSRELVTAVDGDPVEELPEDAGHDEPGLAHVAEVSDPALGEIFSDQTPTDPVPDSVVQFPQFAEARASLMARADGLSEGLEPLSGLTDADGNPVTVIDEAALHEIVRSLIREELQGILGEKITQNVRKLVRAEINRALTARSLD